MKLAIMQPYFLPYIGYWQLINCADEFIIYDNIEYTKKGWFNRNRILEIDHDRLFTLPIKKGSDFLPVNHRFLSNDSDKEISRTLRIIESSYKKAPYFELAYPIIRDCFGHTDKNLFNYILYSVKEICRYMGITTEIVISSNIDIDHSLRGEDKVLALCKAEGATSYINAIGGTSLYDKQRFVANGLELRFIKTETIEYRQFNNKFVPSLSVIDIMMFNSKDEIREMLGKYTLV
jgi:hypothetical protein